MLQHGRKSVEALSVAPLIEPPPPAPDDFNEFQRNLWDSTVASRAAGYFRPESHEQIRAYVMHAWYCRCVDAQISTLLVQASAPNATPAETLALARMFDKLLATRERETNAMLGAARALRITNQSLDKKVAAARIERPTAVPWQAR